MKLLDLLAEHEADTFRTTDGDQFEIGPYVRAWPFLAGPDYRGPEVSCFPVAGATGVLALDPSGPTFLGTIMQGRQSQ
jgi:hypothetical protein